MPTCAAAGERSLLQAKIGKAWAILADWRLDRKIFHLSVWIGRLIWHMIEFVIGLIIFGLIVYVLLH
jgi:hypothetical protein